MNFKLIAFFAVTLVSAQDSALQACKGDNLCNDLINAIYIDQANGFVTGSNSFVPRSSLPAKHRVVGSKYSGDFQYIQDRLTITVNQNDKVVSLSCN